MQPGIDTIVDAQSGSVGCSTQPGSDICGMQPAIDTGGKQPGIDICGWQPESVGWTQPGSDILAACCATGVACGSDVKQLVSGIVGNGQLTPGIVFRHDETGIVGNVCAELACAPIQPVTVV